MLVLIQDISKHAEGVVSCYFFTANMAVDGSNEKKEGQLLQILCTDDQYRELQSFLSNNQQTKPADFQGRLKIATDLRDVAKRKFDAGDMTHSIFFGLASIHYLDLPEFELSQLPSSQLKDVHDAVVPELLQLSIAMRRAKKPKQAVTAVNLAFGLLSGLAKEESESITLDLYFSRALAKGDARDFEGAYDDASELLKVSPNHKMAKIVLKNSRVAHRRERGHKEYRWVGPLDAMPEKGSEEPWLVYLQYFSAVVVLLGMLIVKFMPSAPGLADD